MNILLIGQGGRMNALLAQQAQQQGWNVYRGSSLWTVDAYLNAIKAWDIDCLVDFSRDDFWEILLELVQKTFVPVVSGTTGIKGLIEKKNQLSQFVPLLHAANFSLGVAFFKKLLKQKMPTEQVKIELKEIHHVKKYDVPSGTSIELAEILHHPLDQIVSVRQGDELGTHEVKLSFQDEEIILIHKAANRAVFAQGAIAAVPWLIEKKPGCYSMEDYLNEEHILCQ